MILSDSEILSRCSNERPMIEPFVPFLVRNEEKKRIISYGLSSFGYDIRLSSKGFKVFRHIPGQVVDPKNFNDEHLELARLHTDAAGDFFILPGHSYGLGVAVERLDVPRDILIECLGKSTYARAGVIANVTPAEPGWRGHLTLEFSNSSSADCRIYANEGVVQLVFHRGIKPCEISYADRKGKYQDQPQSVVTPKL